MPIKVAYDISNLGDHYGRPDSVTGINRVVFEVLKEVSKRDDLEMSAVALNGDDPLDDCTRAALSLDAGRPAPGCEFVYTFYPGPGLTKAYKAVYRAMYSASRAPSESRGPRATSVRYLRSALHRLAHYQRPFFPKKIFDRKKFDVFHCPHTFVPARDRTGGLPRVFTMYDLIPVVRPEFVSSAHSAWFQELLDRINVDEDWVVSISEFTKAEFCDRTGMSPGRVVVAPLAASGYFHPVTDSAAIAATRARYQIPEGEYLLCLAAPQPRKNLAHLIQSFFRLLDRRRRQDTYLVLAGSTGLGWMYDEIFATANSSAEYRPRLIFTEYVAEEDLAALYSGAAAFVFPSLYEGFGLPALEAMACGTPVITSSTTSLPEVVGDAGLLVDPTDPDQLCDAMSRVLSDASLGEELKRKGLKRAAEFSWTRCADLTASVYHLAAAS